MDFRFFRYYLNKDGSYARNQWIQSNGKWYYVLSNGKMGKKLSLMDIN